MHAGGAAVLAGAGGNSLESGFQQAPRIGKSLTCQTRPTRQTVWPGEDPAEPVEDRIIANRDEDFVQFVLDDVAARKQAEDEFYAGLDPATGELRD